MQKDLFGGVVAATILPSQSEPRLDFLQKYRFNLRLDQAIIAILGLVVAYVLVFSFGVESGKRYAMAEIKAERAMRERMARELGEKIFSSTNQQAVTGAATALKPIDLKSQSSPVSKIAEAPKAAPVNLKSEKATASVEDAVEPVSKGKYLIQTVTFTSKATAEKHLQKLTAKGYQGLIIAKGKFQQVCVSGFETRQKANQAMVRLKNEGLAPKDAYIRPVA